MLARLVHSLHILHRSKSNLIRPFSTTISTMSSPKHYNALILGSGQAGGPLANHIKAQGQTVCLVESEHIGGCCVNEGCTPTKTMVASGRIAHLSRRAAQYGVHVNGPAGGQADVQVDMQRVRQRKRDIVTQFRTGNEKRLQNNGVEVLMGTASFIGDKTIQVRFKDAEKQPERVTADKIFINIGCRPSKASISGLQDVDQSRILDSTSIQELGEVPKHLVVLGGGVIGLEFGQLLRRLGAKVTIVQRSGRLFAKREDPELAECMANILREDGIEILFNSSASSISSSNDANLPLTLTLSHASATKTETTIHASHLLVATGRIPNTDTLNPSASGIRTTPTRFIAVSPTLATNVEGIYALGDVKGGPAFTHVSYDDFRILRDSLYPATTSDPKNPQAAPRTVPQRDFIVPSVTYTDPQYATVGIPLSALPASKTYVTYSMPATWIARGLETAETRGMLKAVVDPETNRIVHFAGIATEAGEVMSVVQAAMMGGLTWMDLRDAVWAHPTWSEALNNLWGGERREVSGGKKE